MDNLPLATLTLKHLFSLNGKLTILPLCTIVSHSISKMIVVLPFIQAISPITEKPPLTKIADNTSLDIKSSYKGGLYHPLVHTLSLYKKEYLPKRKRPPIIRESLPFSVNPYTSKIYAVFLPLPSFFASFFTGAAFGVSSIVLYTPLQANTFQLLKVVHLS